MTGLEPNSGLEEEILSPVDAQKRAEDHRDAGQHDPFPEIPPSLLAAEHVKKYVMATGAISPFYTGGGRQSRMKMAAYEGRIGKQAYMYNKKGMLESLDFDKELTVRANSIVFVECDLDFRLPNYLALRFNLQIRHVHRGLLLGTGPLVDPGYWGKLCIPLHNLTDEDYTISRDDGLIWVEFTKTTAVAECTETPGRPPLELLETNKGYWEIREFIERAARPRNGKGASVPIRSSISKVRRRAERAARSAKKAQRWAFGIGVGASVVGAATIAALAFALLVFVKDTYNSLDSSIHSLEERFSSVEKITTDAGAGHLPSAVREITSEVEELRKRLSELEKDVPSIQEGRSKS